MTISSGSGASGTMKVVESKCDRIRMFKMWDSGISMVEPGRPRFLVDAKMATPPTAARNGWPNFGCSTAARCSISPAVPTIPALP